MTATSVRRRTASRRGMPGGLAFHSPGPAAGLAEQRQGLLALCNCLGSPARPRARPSTPSPASPAPTPARRTWPTSSPSTGSSRRAITPATRLSARMMLPTVPATGPPIWPPSAPPSKKPATYTTPEGGATYHPRRNPPSTGLDLGQKRTFRARLSPGFANHVRPANRPGNCFMPVFEFSEGDADDQSIH